MKRFCLLMLNLLALNILASKIQAGQNDSAWDDAWSEFEEVEQQASPFSYSTNLEAAFGMRTQNDPAISNDLTLAELRNRWNFFYDEEKFSLAFKADLVIDEIDHNVLYQTREANIFYRFNDHLEIKLGRQILTWGTGDLVFLNDLFPKDWQSFFLGRDTRYLKAPSDAAKVSVYSDFVNIDLVYTPQFDADTFINGTRISYFSSFSGDYEGTSSRLATEYRTDYFGDAELALRVNKTISGSEYALYFYDGFFKSPTGIKPERDISYFPELQVIGASYRTGVLGGIINAEIANYSSKEDKHGQNPFIPNDQQRYLLGFEKELITNFTFALQYYLEITKDYQDLIANSRAPDLETKEHRRVITNRLTYRILNDNLSYSLFSFYSPSDKDGYLRPAITYRFSDSLHLDFGGNYFFGKKLHAFFNRFENNSSLYIRTKYYF